MTEEVVIENDYNPTKTANLFHGSDARFIVLVGGMGSGKSRAAVEEVIRSGLDYPGLPIGVFRKTMPALRDSTLHEYKDLVPPGIGHYKEREEKYLFNTKPKSSFVNFRGLDDPRKAKSTEYGLIVMEEADEFTFQDFKYLNGRVRKKGPWPLRIVLVLNPVDEEHWIYEQFVLNKRVYESNGGLLVLQFSTRENIKNLPPGYIEQNTAGMSEEEIARYVDGAWGSLPRGKPVYADALNPDLHLRRMDPREAVTLLRGWDFGYNRPACSFRLVDPLGRMNINHAMMGHREELEVFAGKVLTETMNRYGRGITVFDYGDPRGHDKGQGKADTAFEVLESLGIFAKGERGSREYVEPGIKQVRKEFSTLIGGIPKLTIDPSVELIRKAYFSKYVRGNDGSPVKDGHYDHIADADRYISHHHKHNDAVLEAIRRQQEKSEARKFRRSSVTGY